MFNKLWKPLALLATVLAAPAMASTSAAPGAAQSRFPWMNQAQYRECGQSCLYQRANENLSLQALYHFRKIRELRAAEDGGRTQVVLDNLRGFCGSIESSRDCLSRYERAMAPVFRQLQQGLGKNSDMVGKLRGETRNLDPQGNVVDARQLPFTIALEGAADDSNKQAQMPHLPTTQELQADAARLRTLMTRDYQRWAESIPRQPSREEFVRFREIPRDPSNPAGERIEIIATAPDGSVSYDDEAFARATLEWQARRADLQRDFQVMSEQDPSRRPGSASASPVEAESRRAYNDARGLMVVSVNSAASGRPAAVPGEVSFPGRQPSAAAPGATEQARVSADTSRAPTGFTGEERVNPVPQGVRADNLYVSVTAGALDEALQRLNAEREAAPAGGAGVGVGR